MGNTFLNTIKENNDLANSLNDLPAYEIAIASNVVVNQMKDSLELPLRKKGINAQAIFGDYDNITQDSAKFRSSQATVIFWEACNLVDGLHYKSLNMKDAEIEELLQRAKAEIQLTIGNLSIAPIVLINKFSSLLFNQYFIHANRFDYIVNELNEFLLKVKTRNCHIVDIDKIIAQTGAEAAFNKRFWYSSKMLYTVNFFQKYAEHVTPFFLSILGKSKKALVMDCDNTMWKGVVGEDLVSGIEISKNSRNGVFFEEIQYLSKSLSQNRIVLAINSKNNIEDVKAVFDGREDMVLKWDDFVQRKINWRDKVSNLKEIARDLNIGVDSLVHVDDSDFEINFIKQEMPATVTIQVPLSLSDYPFAFRKNMNLFFSTSSTKEDNQRVEMYKHEQFREENKTQFGTIEDYLRSLDLEMTIHLNNKQEIARIAQMTQKTNQFNFTTIRYTETEIESKMNDGNHFVFSFALKDKFGDYGITGLSIVTKKKGAEAYIDTLLMSCRIIGRNVEFAFFDFLILFLRQQSIAMLKTSYIKTFKNSQIANFYENLDLKYVSMREEQKNYQLEIDKYKPKEINYIKINYEG